MTFPPGPASKSASLTQAERLDGLKQPDAQALSTLVVLGDERTIKPTGGLDDGLITHREYSPWRRDAPAVQHEVLAELAHLEFKGIHTVDDPPTVSLEPIQDLLSQFDGRGVPTRVRRGADSIDPDALFGFLQRVDETLHELDGANILEALRGETLQQRRQPGRVLVQDVNGRK